MYNKYLYRNSIWVEEKLPQAIELLATNLFVRGIGYAIKSFIDLKTKQAIIKEHGSLYPYDRHEQFGPIHPNCRAI